jgi:hypothetical protein
MKYHKFNRIVANLPRLVSRDDTFAIKIALAGSAATIFRCRAAKFGGRDEYVLRFSRRHCTRASRNSASACGTQIETD